MGKILDGRQAPRGLTLATMCPPLPEGGAAHIHGWLTRNPGALVFTGIMGVPIRRQNFKKLTGWPHAVEAIGMPGLHFHDLRHTGNQFAANSGAALRDLMTRMGHGRRGRRPGRGARARLIARQAIPGPR